MPKINFGFAKKIFSVPHPQTFSFIIWPHTPPDKRQKFFRKQKLPRYSFVVFFELCCHSVVHFHSSNICHNIFFSNKNIQPNFIKCLLSLVPVLLSIKNKNQLYTLQATVYIYNGITAFLFTLHTHTSICNNKPIFKWILYTPNIFIYFRIAECVCMCFCVIHRY